ncbi:MAG: hypothetical protein ACRESZ_10160 [Methylococcales bacterium]
MTACKGHIGCRLLKMEGIEVDSAIDSVKRLLEEERELSPALKSALEALPVLGAALLNRLTLNSRNSRQPPSTDPNRRKSGQRGPGDHRPGVAGRGAMGSHGGAGGRSRRSRGITVDHRSLPKGRESREAGYETRPAASNSTFRDS